MTWSQFLHSQTAVASDFFTIDSTLLRRYYVLLFMHIPTCQVFYAGTTANPTGAWTTQAARNLFLQHSDQLTDARALVRDRGSQFVDSFDEIFRTEGFKILKTPVRTPVANTFAERWIGSIRRELLKQPEGLPRTPSSGTAANSNASSPTTSTTTTSIGPTSPLTRDRQQRPTIPPNLHRRP